MYYSYVGRRNEMPERRNGFDWLHLYAGGDRREMALLVSDGVSAAQRGKARRLSRGTQLGSQLSQAETEQGDSPGARQECAGSRDSGEPASPRDRYRQPDGGRRDHARSAIDKSGGQNLY